MNLRRIFALPLLALCATCGAPRPPELFARVQSDIGVVRAARSETAHAMAALLDEIGPLVLNAIPGLDGHEVDIRTVAELARPNWGGVTFKTHEQRWIEMPNREGAVELKRTLAHELVHYWLDDSWATLPSVIEEGLCNWVALRVVSENSLVIRLHDFMALMSLVDPNYQLRTPAIHVAYFGEMVHLAIGTTFLFQRFARERVPPPREALAMTSPLDEPIDEPGIRTPLDAIGQFVVSRIGIDELRNLCLRARRQGLARVPSDWLLAAAGLDPDDYAKWRRAIEASFGPAEQSGLNEYLLRNQTRE